MSREPLSYDMEDVVRFLDKIEVLDSGCWFWTGARSRGGGNRRWYGSFRVGGRTVRAHRFSLLVFKGVDLLEPGHHRDHGCSFSLCVCPDCLEVVTHEENQRRKMARCGDRNSWELEALDRALARFLVEDAQGTMST